MCLFAVAAADPVVVATGRLHGGRLKTARERRSRNEDGFAAAAAETDGRGGDRRAAEPLWFYGVLKIVT